MSDQATQNATPVDQVIGMLTAAFNAYGQSFGAPAVPQTLAAAKSFEDALGLTRKVFIREATPTVAVPEGFWLAPNRVTPEMTGAALEVDDLYRMGQPELPGRLFQAMRREAPLPPAVTITAPATSAPTEADVQAKFEAWACSPKGKYGRGALLKFNVGTHQHAIDGLTYVNTAVEQDWQVWQAAAV